MFSISRCSSPPRLVSFFVPRDSFSQLLREISTPSNDASDAPLAAPPQRTAFSRILTPFRVDPHALPVTHHTTRPTHHHTRSIPSLIHDSRSQKLSQVEEFHSFRSSEVQKSPRLPSNPSNPPFSVVPTVKESRAQVFFVLAAGPCIPFLLPPAAGPPYLSRHAPARCG